MIHVQINGKSYSFENSPSLDDILSFLKLDKTYLAVAINLEVIPKSDYSKTKISDKDKIEIIHGVGGG